MSSNEDGWVEDGNWKLISPEGREFLKVIDFPVPKGVPLAGESMWVEKVSGTDFEGYGRLNSKPIFCVEVVYGDMVSYSGGTTASKPHYQGPADVKTAS